MNRVTIDYNMLRLLCACFFVAGISWGVALMLFVRWVA